MTHDREGGCIVPLEFRLRVTLFCLWARKNRFRGEDRKIQSSTPSLIHPFLTSHTNTLSDNEWKENNDNETGQNDFNIDPLLMIQNHGRVKPKARTLGVLNKKRTVQEAEFENSTTYREPLRFE